MHLALLLVSLQDHGAAPSILHCHVCQVSALNPPIMSSLFWDHGTWISRVEGAGENLNQLMRVKGSHSGFQYSFLAGCFGLLRRHGFLMRSTQQSKTA